jgi:hypothetical protein
MHTLLTNDDLPETATGAFTSRPKLTLVGSVAA